MEENSQDFFTNYVQEFDLWCHRSNQSVLAETCVG
jgi:hypothetical protein